MGTTIVVGAGDKFNLQAIQELFATYDACFSRFVPGSELNRVNDSSGNWVHVSSLFADVLRTALWARDVSDGLVDMTIANALVAAGYSRDFSQLPKYRSSAVTSGDRSPEPARVQQRGRLVRVTNGSIDLNGVVKSLAVDNALKLLNGRGFVSAGGDIATNTPIDVAIPGDSGECVRLERGGLATSGTTRRRWHHAGQIQHHLIDPSTGRPSDSVWSEVTIAGASCLHAERCSKVCISDE